VILVSSTFTCHVMLATYDNVDLRHRFPWQTTFHVHHLFTSIAISRRLLRVKI